MALGRRLNYDVAPLSSHRFRKYHHMYITPIILYIISPFVKYILIINKIRSQTFRICNLIYTVKRRLEKD